MPNIVGWLECRLYLDTAVWFPVCVTLFSGCRLRKEGTPECKQHSRWTWPLLTQIGWTPLWPQGTTALKCYCCSTQTIILLSQWKASFPEELLRLTANRCEDFIAKRKKKNDNDSIERQGRNYDMRPSRSRRTQKAISAVSNKNCRDECKHYNTIRCECWINQLWVSDEKKQQGCGNALIDVPITASSLCLTRAPLDAPWNIFRIYLEFIQTIWASTQASTSRNFT